MHCLIIQPIHTRGLEILKAAGVEPREASAPDMETISREIPDAVAAITRNAGLNGPAIRAASNLQVIGNHGTGYDPIDVEYATANGIPIIYTPHANIRSVAEHAISQMLLIAKRGREADRSMRSGNYDYRYSRDFIELTGKTLGIVGFGKIGRKTAEIARTAFDMRVLVHSPSIGSEAIVAAGCEVCGELDTLLSEADVISLHQRLTDDTRHMINATRLKSMKAGAMLINTARGALVDPDALIKAVDSGHLRGAAMDVFDPEPLPPGHPLIDCDGIVLSPHIGGATEEALIRTAEQTANQVVDILQGRKPEFLVNPEVWSTSRVRQT